jgi:hypothetical protein
MKTERFFEGQRVPAPILDKPDKPVTRQAIFDRVVRHHRKQRRRCPVEGQCFYRFAGDVCFVGALIDDDWYDSEMEGYRVRDLLRVFAMPACFRDNIGFIEELQTIHDTETNWPGDRMEMILELFAAERRMTIPSV